MSKKVRNPYIKTATLGRKTGPMKHRTQPRGGAFNHQEQILTEWYDEECDFLDEIIEERTAKNPNFPDLMKESAKKCKK